MHYNYCTIYMRVYKKPANSKTVQRRSVVYCTHELNNYKDTKPYVVFTGVYRMEIESVILVFSTQLCELLPL
jgi:hypothetical protein